VFLISDCKFKYSLDHAKRAFYRAAIDVFGKVARAASEEVVLHIVKCKLQYGLETCTLSKDDLLQNGSL